MDGERDLEGSDSEDSIGSSDGALNEWYERVLARASCRMTMGDVARSISRNRRLCVRSTVGVFPGGGGGGGGGGRASCTRPLLTLCASLP